MSNIKSEQEHVLENEVKEVQGALLLELDKWDALQARLEERVAQIVAQEAELKVVQMLMETFRDQVSHRTHATIS